MPRVTVVTICYRNPDDLRRTLDSLRPLDADRFERLVIDGSPDTSCEDVSRTFADVRHIRERDTGKYDAMNKGIAKARGDTLLFMNSGDLLVSAAQLQDAVATHTDILSDTLIYGDAIFEIGGEAVYVPAPTIRQDMVAKGVLPSHQAILIPVRFHHSQPYDDAMHFTADTKLLKIAFAALPALHLPFAIARFAYGGVSNSSGSWRSIYRQWRELHDAHDLGPREALGSALFLMRRKVFSGLFGEAWFRRVQRERLIASGRARAIDPDNAINPPCPPAV